MGNFWINLLISVILPTLTCLASLKWVVGHDSGKWTIAYTSIAGIVSVLILAFTEFRRLYKRFERLSPELAEQVTRDEVFKTNTIAQDLLRIEENENDFLATIAAIKLRELRICLDQLKNEYYIAEGAEVYEIYKTLIDELGDGDEYLATTYANDPFWDEPGSAMFLEANYQAICRGARITRVFLYKGAPDELQECQAIQKHLGVVRRCDDSGREGNMELFAIEISKVTPSRASCTCEDKGILKDTFVMSLDQDLSGWQKAMIATGKDVIKEEKLRYHNLRRHKDLRPLSEIIPKKNIGASREPAQLTSQAD